jgi:Family of unknown function (DUF6703)
VRVAKSKRKPSSARTNPAPAKAGRATSGPARAKPTQPHRAEAAPSTAKTGETALRMAVADRSRGVVVWLARQPPLLIPAVMLALMLIGLVVSTLAIAVPALALVVVFVGWLAFLSWPVLAPGQRAIRVVMIGVVLFAALGRVAGWF